MGKVINDDEQGRLYVAADMWPDGIRVNHVFGNRMAAESFKASILESISTRSVFSASVVRSIDVELDVLYDAVAYFRHHQYNAFMFNCQHFATIFYHRFTGTQLGKQLRHRWTANCNREGDDAVDMSWAEGIEELVQLTPVKSGGSYLFSRSPRAMGKATVAGVVVGTAVNFINPVGGAVISAAALAGEIPAFCRFQRTTTWFFYKRKRRQGMVLVAISFWRSRA